MANDFDYNIIIPSKNKLQVLKKVCVYRDGGPRKSFFVGGGGYTLWGGRRGPGLGARSPCMDELWRQKQSRSLVRPAGSRRSEEEGQQSAVGLIPLRWHRGRARRHGSKMGELQEACSARLSGCGGLDGLASRSSEWPVAGMVWP